MRILVALLLGAWSTFACAQHVHPIPQPDPYQLNETSLQIGPPGSEQLPSRDVNSKTLSSQQTVNTGIQNCVLIPWGQSNNANVAPTPFVPVNPDSIDNLNIYDGAIYKATDPLVGSSYVFNPPPQGGHPALRLADALVTAGKCARVILVPVSIDGTLAAQWATGTLSGRLTVAIRRIAQRGIICGGTGVVCVMLGGGGESDCQQGTSQVSIVASLNTVISTAITAGFVGRWLFAKESYFNGSTCSAVQNAQTQNSPTGIINTGASIFLGAIADNLVGNVCAGTLACRQSDGLHWTDAGSQSYAVDPTSGWQKALQNSGAPF